MTVDHWWVAVGTKWSMIVVASVVPGWAVISSTELTAVGSPTPTVTSYMPLATVAT